MAAEHANWLSGLSAQHNLIIGCTMITRDATGFRNTFHLFIPGQTEAATYHKTHLFRMLREEHYFVPGSAVVTADLGFATAGLATCYDLRFPELFRSLALQGANLFLICAEWGAARTEHWRVFARARAIENQVFLAAVNATGTSGSNEFAGHSVIVSPWGDALAEAGTEPGLVTATIDLDEIERNRKLLPVFQDRRPDLYRV
jgi:predicted amidohydrolase